MITAVSILAKALTSGAVGGMLQHGIRQIQLALDPSARLIAEFSGDELPGNT